MDYYPCIPLTAVAMDLDTKDSPAKWYTWEKYKTAEKKTGSYGITCDFT